MGSKFSVSRMKKELNAQTMTSITLANDSVFQSGLVLSDVGTIAASGSNIATAETVAHHVEVVTAADGTKGVKLPTGVTTGEVYVVGNHTAAILKLYATSETLNGIAGATGLSVSGSAAALCVKSAASAWTVILP